MPMLLSVDMDPYDLEVVYPDPDGDTSEHRLDIDIVAVPGVNIEGNFLHHREAWILNRRLWLRDMLPKVFANRCRVMLFSYNFASRLADEDTRLGRHSDRLLDILKEKRMEAPNRPLLFVCHDVGGLIVKDALATAYVNMNYKSIGDNTRVLVFFGTPHHDVGQSVRAIAEASIKAPDEEVIEKLEKECDLLVKRIERWETNRRLFDRRLILNFYATNPHRGRRILVTRESTLLNLPDYWEKHFPIYGDHTSMCKFDSSRDAGYKMVIKTIAMEVARAWSSRQVRKVDGRA